MDRSARHISVFTLALVALLPSGFAQSRDGQGAVGLGDTPARLNVSSTHAGITFTLLDKLPRAPAGARRAAETCGHYVVQPRTAGGRTARAFGWSVTGEARLGPLTAVSFAGKFEPATSGTCVVEDGNVGLFNEDGALVALAYAKRGAKTSIGKATEIEGGAVRVWDGDPPGMPVADIERHLGGTQVQLGAVAPQETLCGGRATVPNIYGKPINEARKLLWARGWAPIPTRPAPEAGTREAELGKRGMTEVDGCSGTGFGYCSYNYRGEGGVLNVSTIGDNDFPSVSGYAVKCP